MACTIVSTPATGAADWTGWITQQGLTDRGFMRVSLTEFATTAASLVGTGSVFELAGSIYNNTTEASIALATGTASANVAVYYVAIPSAGGTTCTFTMDSVAPTWVDAKQGYYASAASTSRYLGGSSIGTAATYYNKFIYTPDMVFGYLLPQTETRPILKKILEIGDWNMYITGGGSGASTKDVAHGIADYKKIRTVFVIIRDDSDDLYLPLQRGVNPTDTTLSGFLHSWNSANVVLNVLIGGGFDITLYNSTSYNRGWVTIEYEA